MPCDQCTDPARCENFGVCQSLKFPLPPAPCKPGTRCSRSAQGLQGCEAGVCRKGESTDGVEEVPGG